MKVRYLIREHNLFTIWEDKRMRFTYCPQCGLKLTLKEIGDEGFIPFCISCSKPYFDWFGQCTISAVVNEFNEVALLNHKGAASTHWGLVAGHLKQGETLEQSAIREVNEETGQEVDHIEYISSYYHEKKELLIDGSIAKQLLCEVN